MRPDEYKKRRVVLPGGYDLLHPVERRVPHQRGRVVHATLRRGAAVGHVDRP